MRNITWRDIMVDKGSAIPPRIYTQPGVVYIGHYVEPDLKAIARPD